MEEGGGPRCCGVHPLFEVLQELGIQTHIMFFLPREQRNAENSRGTFCKNLFLKDRKGMFYLVVTEQDREVDLKMLKKKVGAHRNFSFGTEDELDACLGLAPGGVTPFGLINDKLNHTIHVVLDKSLTLSHHNLLNFHPFDKRLTVLLTFESLEKFIVHCGHKLTYVDL